MGYLRSFETQLSQLPDSLFLCSFSERSNDMETEEEVVILREISWTLDEMLEKLDSSLDFITDADNDLQVGEETSQWNRLCPRFCLDCKEFKVFLLASNFQSVCEHLEGIRVIVEAVVWACSLKYGDMITWLENDILDKFPTSFNKLLSNLAFVHVDIIDDEIVSDIVHRIASTYGALLIVQGKFGDQIWYIENR